jgi:hypothetical protein
MRSISRYANRHYIVARIFIVITHVLLFTASIYIGTTLTKLGIEIPVYVLLIGSLFILISLLIDGKRPKSYWLQRVSFLLIATGIFLCSCFVFNNNRIASFNIYNPVGGVVPTQVTESANTSKSDKKELRKLLKDLRSEARQADGNAGKIIGTILVILGAAGLLILLAAASCRIACNVSEALAILVGGLGAAGILWLTVWAIKKINKKKISPPADVPVQ